ncbi:hypothetical protein J1614_004395 [Plenodomus biglobosus]|nr:hypothetical protein J1614_004395 [Plenodomus biglobosus]
MTTLLEDDFGGRFDFQGPLLQHAQGHCRWQQSALNSTARWLGHEEAAQILKVAGLEEGSDGTGDDARAYNVNTIERQDITQSTTSVQSMLAPPPRPHCAFGSSCTSCQGGQEKGPDLCSWCKNMSFDALYHLAETRPDSRHLKRTIDAYMHQLERDNYERIAKGWSYLCACKDPRYRFQPWRRDFNPMDHRLCGTVRHRGQLCTRCYQKAQEQHCAWLADFEGDRLGFPCVFEDPRMRRPTDVNWRVGPLDAGGNPDPNWEKDPRKHGRCDRATRQQQLCQKCYDRICEIRGFGRYFDTEWGVLREGYRR